MKSTGIVRPVDELRRVVVPKELRRTLGIGNGDPVEIFTEDDKIILRKYRPGCVFCDNVDNLSEYQGKLICSECIKRLRERI
jgi:transcriptional pleiotropic regulator of transition state genes